jgi:hypothetical protein
MLQIFRGILLLYTDNTEYVGRLRSSIYEHRQNKHICYLNLMIRL